MYAYSMAAAHEQLPHTLVHHLMVSNLNAGDEGWRYVDVLGDNVVNAPVNGIYYPNLPMPVFLHYCSFYRIGDLGFHKRRVPKSLLTCDGPLFIDLPTNSSLVTYKDRDGGPGGTIEVYTSPHTLPYLNSKPFYTTHILYTTPYMYRE